MKAVIQTQQKENYGAHDWDGKGECPEYWKFKGGNVFILDLQLEDAIEGIDLFHKFERAVNFADEYYEEYVLSHKFIKDEAFVESDHMEHWESAIYVDVVDGAFKCERNSLNYQSEVCAVRRWTLDPSGIQLDHSYEEIEEPVVEEWRVKAEMALYGEESA